MKKKVNKTSEIPIDSDQTLEKFTQFKMSYPSMIKAKYFFKDFIFFQNLSPHCLQLDSFFVPAVS